MRYFVGRGHVILPAHVLWSNMDLQCPGCNMSLSKTNIYRQSELSKKTPSSEIRQAKTELAKLVVKQRIVTTNADLTAIAVLTRPGTRMRREEV